jgi:hypothetical protein
MSAEAFCSAEQDACSSVNDCEVWRNIASMVNVPSAICLTASPRSQQELRLNPSRPLPSIHAGNSYVSGLLWLIVALRRPDVKSAPRLLPFFRQPALLVANKGFLRLRSGRRWPGCVLRAIVDAIASGDALAAAATVHEYIGSAAVKPIQDQ